MDMAYLTDEGNACVQVYVVDQENIIRFLDVLMKRHHEFRLRNVKKE